jgi:membrane-associated phospholipid phosphatase
MSNVRMRIPLRAALEVALIAGGLATFATVGFYGLAAYNGALEARGHAFTSPETFVDRYIPLVVGWVWPYLSYFPMCFLPALLLRSMENLRRIALAYAIEFGLGFVCFYLIPMRMAQPEIVGTSLSHDAMRWLYRADVGYNIFPSLHTANAVMIACAFYRLHPRPWGVLVWIWALLIVCSTVLVKQHYAIDLVAGIALAFLADRVAFRGWKKPSLPA